MNLATEDLAAIEARVAALHAQWTDIAVMAREHKDIAVLVTQVARLDLAPGDTLVVTVPGRITQDQCVAMKRMLRMDLGPNQRVLVLDGGITLSTLAGTAGEPPGAKAA